MFIRICVRRTVVLVGDPSVGKTNLLATFLASPDDIADASSDSSTKPPQQQLVNADGTAKGFSSVRKPTIGVEFGTKVVQHPNGKRIKAQIWDTGALLSLSVFVHVLLAPLSSLSLTHIRSLALCCVR